MNKLTVKFKEVKTDNENFKGFFTIHMNLDNVNGSEYNMVFTTIKAIIKDGKLRAYLPTRETRNKDKSFYYKIFEMSPELMDKINDSIQGIKADEIVEIDLGEISEITRKTKKTKNNAVITHTSSVNFIFDKYTIALKGIGKMTINDKNHMIVPYIRYKSNDEFINRDIFFTSDKVSREILEDICNINKKGD